MNEKEVGKTQMPPTNSEKKNKAILQKTNPQCFQGNMYFTKIFPPELLFPV